MTEANVYLTDMNDCTSMNAAYARHFDAPFPARTTIAWRHLREKVPEARTPRRRGAHLSR